MIAFFPRIESQLRVGNTDSWSTKATTRWSDFGGHGHRRKRGTGVAVDRRRCIHLCLLSYCVFIQARTAGHIPKVRLLIDRWSGQGVIEFIRKRIFLIEFGVA